MPDPRPNPDEGAPAVPVRLTWRILDGDVTAEEATIEIPVDQDTPGDPGTVDGAPAEVTIETDVATAAELRAGSLSAQHALLLGRLTLHGAVALLPALAAAIGDAGA